MGKISNELAGLMKTAMKNKESQKLQVIRNIKAKFLEYKTSNDGIKKLVDGEITDAEEIVILNKMIKERNKDIETYVGRQDLIDEANFEINVLSEFVPKAATASEINNVIMDYVNENGDFEQKQMGLVVKYVKSKLSNAEGSLISKQIKAYLNPET